MMIPHDSEEKVQANNSTLLCETTLYHSVFAEPSHTETNTYLNMCHSKHRNSVTASQEYCNKEEKAMKEKQKNWSYSNRSTDTQDHMLIGHFLLLFWSAKAWSHTHTHTHTTTYTEIFSCSPSWTHGRHPRRVWWWDGSGNSLPCTVCSGSHKEKMQTRRKVSQTIDPCIHPWKTELHMLQNAVHF